MRTGDGKSVEREVVADGRKRETIGSEERTPMVLNVEALKACAGVHAINPCIAEDRELYECSHGGRARL